MAASYALRNLARMRSDGGTVLVHGARTAAGRAVIAIAQSMGVHVIVTAADHIETRLMKDEVGIDAADLLVARRSLHRRSPRHIFAQGLDAIVQADDGPIPAEALAYLNRNCLPM